ncbi:MAG: GSCFA domain-containing protein [Acidocella sp.]|nr:GSCFA domain-containing protein [Acidocella sp.]
MSNPYQTLPDTAFWRRAVATLPPEAVDPVVAPPFLISPADAVVTAGSCFAQHIGPTLQGLNFNYLITEPAHPLATQEQARAFNYGVFSARWGNVYTARQLLQLFHRAYGNFYPVEDMWGGENCWIDPFRPQIQPGGFLSQREYKLDRARHFAAIRRAFEALDVFVFTLGLTEAWVSRVDGAVFPLCPGVAGGEFNPARHEFHNFTVGEVAEDMVAFIGALRSVNPRARVILTVSPVPLVATAREGTHVLVATAYSKAVLRVAAEMVTQTLPGVAYFPAYEIITGRYDAGTYFAADRRSVVAPGVSHVMRCFVTGFSTQAGAPAPPPPPASDYEPQMEAAMQVHCDEIALDQG